MNRIGNRYFSLKNNRKEQHSNKSSLSTDAYNKTDVRGNVKALGCKLKYKNDAVKTPLLQCGTSILNTDVLCLSAFSLTFGCSPIC